MRAFFEKMQYVPVVILIFAATILAADTARIAISNSALRKNYVQKELNRSYISALEGRDFGYLPDYFFTWLNPQPVTETGSGLFSDEIRTAASLKYYESPDSNVVAYEIQKGAMIIVRNLDMIGYGRTNYPTARRGWRLAKPFVTTETEPFPEDQYLYVKTSDLIRATTHDADRIKLPRFAQRTVYWTKKSFMRDLILQPDRILYYKGYFFSPDLVSSIINPRTVFLGVILILSVVWTFFSFRKSTVRAVRGEV